MYHYEVALKITSYEFISFQGRILVLPIQVFFADGCLFVFIFQFSKDFFSLDMASKEDELLELNIVSYTFSPNFITI